MSSMDQAVKAFQTEASELLVDMEDGLLLLETNPEDEDSINSIFRAAHTIKGTAGIFGFDLVESFTHVLENLLDEIRDGKVSITEDLIAVLLKCRDHIGVLVDAAVDEEEIADDDKQNNDSLLSQLKVFLGDVGSAEVKTESKTVVAEKVITNTGVEDWHIDLRFSEDVLRGGMDPISFFRYLAKLGELSSIQVDHSALPPLNEMDSETSYLNYVVHLRGEALSKEKIESVFEFVRDDLDLSILPPVERVWEFISSIDSLPDEILSLGELLQQSGTLTQAELLAALDKQQDMRANQGASVEDSKLGAILVNDQIVHEEVVEAALNKQKKSKEKKATGNRQLRVDADKLDGLINLVGELVIAGATSNLLAEQNGDDSLLEAISSMSRLVEEIRDSALRLRMVQIGETFSRFQRVVRDVSRELGKNIQLELRGGETELDKTMVEKIGDPLMHLVRNAMDHGIEPADVRASTNKPVEGNMTLNAFHDSGSIVIQVIDDGKGLDRDVIFNKAVEKGLIEASASMTDQEVFRLIFEPGFSTAAAVTNLSGRGVGMDVVKKNIESLRGTVDVESKKGEGTTINIRLPLTLAIIDGFLVDISGSSYVIPLDMVVECIEMNENDETLSVHSNYINLRGKVLPFLRLRDVFGSDKPPTGRENIVVVHNGTQTAGLVVDELLGEFQTVIKPLGKIFQNLKGVSGSTILGTGEVAVILDVPGLMQKAISQTTTHGFISHDNNRGDSHPVLH
ncbi:MAG: chemotaxis protein CheA [Gammaproteobacteria bacterium]|nr:chemotaxis protein CheA [Gammaproteobacteria bacterium]